MTRKLALMLGAVWCCAATGASSPVTALSGRYYDAVKVKEYKIGPAEHYFGEEIVEIVPISASAAYFRAHLQGSGANVCALWGIAMAKGSTLVYHDTSEPVEGHSRSCTLTISRSGNSLRLDDGPDRSCWDHCGEQEWFSDFRLPWKSRRAITYLSRLKASQQYHDALTEWRARTKKTEAQ